MKQRLNLVTLGVDNLKTARAFFEEGLGWQAHKDSNEKVAFFDTGSSIFGLYGRDDLAEESGATLGEGTPSMSLAWCGDSREDADAAYGRAVKAGAEPLKPMKEVFWGGYSGYVKILGQYLLEISHNPFWPIDEDGRAHLDAPVDASAAD